MKSRNINMKKVNDMAGTGKGSVSENPFLAAIDKNLNTENIPERLATSPLDGIDVSTLGVQERLDLLDRMQEEFFEPMSTSVEVATRLYRLIRKGYINRDPTKSVVRKKTMELADFSGMELSKLPWFSTYAKGMAILGVTGLGKSYEVKRALNLLPQCIEHGRSQAAGWTSMKQVSWLYVAMSHDGSLGGLLQQILSSLDEVLDTQYSQDKGFAKTSNEKLAVRLGIIFRNHGVGVLIIDEIQSRNFEGHGRGGLAATFFLRLLNFGIPVVLMGNPLGFNALYSFSQDARRIGSGGTIRLHPLEKDEFDWKNCLVPALWRQNLMPEPSPIKNPGELLYQYSGGIRDYACRIYFVSQRLAIDLRDRCVTEDHMIQAFNGPDFSDSDRDLIAGFRDKNPLLLVPCEDIPWEEYADRWKLLHRKGPSSNNSEQNKQETKASKGKAEAGSSDAQQKQGQSKPVSKTDLEKIKSKRTREANAKENRSITRNSAGSGDMRGDGLQQYLITGIKSLLDDATNIQTGRH